MVSWGVNSVHSIDALPPPLPPNTRLLKTGDVASHLYHASLGRLALGWPIGRHEAARPLAKFENKLENGQ